MNDSPLFTLKGRTALITGSSRGIGAALAMGLARAGADVIVHCANNMEAAKSVCESIQSLGRRAIPVQGDLGNINAVEHIRPNKSFMFQNHFLYAIIST